MRWPVVVSLCLPTVSISVGLFITEEVGVVRVILIQRAHHENINLIATTFLIYFNFKWMLKIIARRSKTKESGLTIFRAQITFFIYCLSDRRDPTRVT